jgi:hypothetical protein
LPSLRCKAASIAGDSDPERQERELHGERMFGDALAGEFFAVAPAAM